MPTPRTTLALAAIVSALQVPTPLQARDWPVTAGWTIFEDDRFCAMRLSYEGKGETELGVAYYLDGHSVVLLTNAGWTSKRGAKYEMTFALDDIEYSGGVVIGMPVDGRNGFAASFPNDFWARFKSAASMDIEMGETVVDKLDLDGSAAAGAMVERCLADLRRRTAASERAERERTAAAERQRQRFAFISDDPFAGPTPPSSPLRVLGSEAAWVSIDDYPAAARAAGEQGAVTLRLTVGIDGRASGCEVIASSGSAALDETSCTLAQRRARFTPAIGADGKPASGTIERRLRWSLD